MKFLFVVLLPMMSLYGILEAKQLKCVVSANNLNAEGILQDHTLYCYKVHTPAVFNDKHHDGNGREDDYSEMLGPHVVKNLSPVGKLEAGASGYAQAMRNSFVKLGEECTANGCNCKVLVCACLGISGGMTPLPAKNNQAVEGEISLQTKQMEKNATSFENTIVLENIKNIEEIKEAQNAYLRKHYKEEMLHSIINMYTVRERRYIHIIGLQDETGQVKLVFFDMTDTYKKIEKRSGKAVKLKIRELMARHEPVKK